MRRHRFTHSATPPSRRVVPPSRHAADPPSRHAADPTSARAAPPLRPRRVGPPKPRRAGRAPVHPSHPAAPATPRRPAQAAPRLRRAARPHRVARHWSVPDLRRASAGLRSPRPPPSCSSQWEKGRALRRRTVTQFVCTNTRVIASPAIEP
ncbi:putative uncharacterized protein MGC34800 [Panicum virgatum]|uniref:putative uncharacterized protein MGC34800 n=1 Tax=Panicum virgatum TaxID=38727 RepID=UPI0019D5C868|nr:putative uncharacterized protein MGC34800 [Panicum virgatum]